MKSNLRLEVSNVAAAFCALCKFITKFTAIVNSACDEKMQSHSLFISSQKNAALPDLEIWVDIEKLESNQEPRLRTSDLGLMYIVLTRT